MATRGRPKNTTPKVAQLPKEIVNVPAITPVNKPIDKPAADVIKLEKPGSRVEKKHVDASSIWEKIPLGLTVSYQSFVVALWNYRELLATNGNLPEWMNYLYALFAACAGLSLDLVMIGTALRNDKKGGTHLATLFSAWIASSAIAFSYFTGAWYERLLHITWSTMVFLFSWSLAEGRGSTISSALSDVWKKIKG